MVAKEGAMNIKYDGKNVANSIAMVITLVSFTMLFAVFFLGYAIFRFNAQEWPPMGMDKVGLGIPSLSTLIIVLSSVSLVIVEGAIKQGDKKKAKYIGLISLILGFGFIGSQFTLWESLRDRGIFQGTGIYASLIYGFTWTHVGHMVLAVILKLWLVAKVFRVPELKELKENVVKNISAFWHFLGVIWVLIYVTLFVL